MDERRFRRLCRRRGCCPEISLPGEGPWAAVLREPGGGDRPPATLSMTAEELTELARVLDEAGWVDRAKERGR